MRATCLVLLALVVVITAKVIPPTSSEHWYNTQEKVAGEQPVTLQFALKQRNLDWLEQTLLEVSDPTSNSYGKHLNLYQIADKIAPFHHQIEKVLNWLRVHSIEGKVPESRDWVVAETTVQKAEELLHCSFFIYKNLLTNNIAMRVKEYTIPDELSSIIDFVAGINTMPFARRILAAEDPYDPVTPDTLYTLYSVDVPSTSTVGSSQAVVEFNQNNYSPSDLQLFFEKYQPDLVGQVVDEVYGTNKANGRISIEANLDVQYLMALGAFVNTTDYVLPFSLNILDSFLQYTYIVGNQTSPPLVHSISYGEYGGSYDNSTDQRINVEFQKMGLRGISILLASGDNGVGCGEKCQSLEFDFPSSPYITMVGATQLQNGKESGATLSSGGFSKNFPQPSYQSSAVNGYLSSGIPLPSQSFPPGGRAYPDVAAIGQNVQVMVKGEVKGVGGTSCSAPIFGGIISLINNERLAAGKSPLGFLNPWLYQNPSLLTDITQGSNPYECCDGFEASVGWDPVTGLGTPIYSAMLASALSLP